MKVYLYLHPTQLDVLRYARLHFSAVSDLACPFQNNARAISRAGIRITEEEFQQEVQRQFKQLPAQLKGLMPWEVFQQEAQKKRPQIEMRMKKSRQPKTIKLPNPEIYKGLAYLRLNKRPDNLTAWERWADNHRGLVLELETALPTFNSKKQILQPVNYGVERPSQASKSMPFPALFTRPKAFASEEEVRLIRPLDEAQKSQSLTNGKLVYFYAFPPKALTSVTLGVNASADLKEQVSKILTYDMKYKPGKPLRQVLLDPETFKLHIRGTL